MADNEALEDYESDYSGQDIDDAVLKVRTPDSTPTENSQKLVTSGGVYAAIGSAIISAITDAIGGSY